MITNDLARTTETAYVIMPKDEPLACAPDRLRRFDYTLSVDALEAVMDGHPSNRELFRIVRIDVSYTITSLDAPVDRHNAPGRAKAWL